MFPQRERNILIVLVFFTILFISLSYISTFSGALEVHFLDIGQGDAIFIQTPSHRQILVDGGYGSKVLEQLDRQMPFYDRSIDFVVATHMDADHIGGLVDVLEKFEVGAVLITNIVPPSSIMLAESVENDAQNAEFEARDSVVLKFWEKVHENGAKLVRVGAGDRFWVDNDIYFDVVWPPNETPTVLSDNNKSMVMKLVYKNDSFLLTGDMEKFAEYKLAQSSTEVSVGVLKVAHHGSNSSSVKYFLDKTQAKIAVIQVGKNPFGHPHEETLERLKKFGMQILRNDLNGIISMYSYGNSF